MEDNFTIDQIINVMKKTKKTDVLFKPLKKLKTALENIGTDNVSLIPTNRVLLFHFGLGNELDQEFVRLLAPKNLKSNVKIIPGQSYCLLDFLQIQDSVQFLSTKIPINDRPLYYCQLQYQNLSRIVVFLYCKDHFLKEEDIIVVSNCPSKYEVDTIPGLIIHEEIISKEEEIDLMKNIDKQQWQRLNNRRVQHYGYDFKYGRNQVDKDESKGKLPQFLMPLLQRLQKMQILSKSSFDQLTINDYFAGNGIPAHFDTHSPFEEIFISISLLSSLVMDFRKYDGQQKSVRLNERSLVIFSGQARYAWTHGIACRKIDKVDNELVYRSRRISLTFRQIKHTPCQCPYFFYCDSQGYDQNTMKKNNPLLIKYLNEAHSKEISKMSSEELEKEYVERAYNGFGFDFHNKVIHQVKEYIQRQFEQQIVLDIGCGNGQYLKYMPKSVYYISIQKCTIMVPVQNEFHMDCLNLAFRDELFDKILFVAVLHHLASQKNRIIALQEAYRVLKKGGIMYLTVLNYQEKVNLYTTQDIFLQYCLPVNKIPEKMSKPQILYQKPKSQSRGQIYKRYYHLFLLKQIIELCEKSNFIILQTLTSKDNHILKLLRPKD